MVIANEYYTIEDTLSFLGGIIYSLKLIVSLIGAFLIMYYTINLVKLIKRSDENQIKEYEINQMMTILPQITNQIEKR